MSPETTQTQLNKGENLPFEHALYSAKFSNMNIYPICPACKCNTIVGFAKPREPFTNSSKDFQPETAELYCCNGETNCNYRIKFYELTTPMNEKKYSVCKP